MVLCEAVFVLVITELHWLQMENSGVVHMLKNKKTVGEYLTKYRNAVHKKIYEPELTIIMN